MIRHLALSALAAAIIASPASPAGCETTTSLASTPAVPPQKGDPNLPHEVHPEFPTAPPPDPRTNGRWMVYALGTDEAGSHNVTCWINSDMATFREVPITAGQYEEYLANQDTGSIPCPD